MKSMRLPNRGALLGLALALLLAPTYWAYQTKAKPSPQQKQGDGHAGHQPGAGGNVMDRVPDYYRTEAEARPFPQTLDPNQFTNPAVRRAYQAAREIPGVLAQQPCYCYCDRMGHKGLLACHRDTHSAG